MAHNFSMLHIGPLFAFLQGMNTGDVNRTAFSRHAMLPAPTRERAGSAVPGFSAAADAAIPSAAAEEPHPR